MIDPDLPSITGGVGETTANDYYGEYIIRGAYGRINYDYQGKYLLEVNVVMTVPSVSRVINRLWILPLVLTGLASRT